MYLSVWLLAGIVVAFALCVDARARLRRRLECACYCWSEQNDLTLQIVQHFKDESQDHRSEDAEYEPVLQVEVGDLSLPVQKALAEWRHGEEKALKRMAKYGMPAGEVFRMADRHIWAAHL